MQRDLAPATGEGIINNEAYRVAVLTDVAAMPVLRLVR